MNKIFMELIQLYGFSFSSKIRTFQRWYFGTPYEYVEKNIPSEGVIVDLGCGWGVFANILAIKSAKRIVYGIDLDEKKIMWAKKTIGNRKNINFEVQDLGSLKLSSVDSIVIYDVLHHLDEQTQINVLTECFFKLKQGGTLIIKENDVVPYHKFIISHLVEAIALGFKITVSNKISFRSIIDWVKILDDIKFNVKYTEHIKTPYGFFVPHSLIICEKN